MLCVAPYKRSAQRQHHHVSQARNAGTLSSGIAFRSLCTLPRRPISAISRCKPSQAQPHKYPVAALTPFPLTCRILTNLASTTFAAAAHVRTGVAPCHFHMIPFKPWKRWRMMHHCPIGGHANGTHAHPPQHAALPSTQTDMLVADASSRVRCFWTTSKASMKSPSRHSLQS